jgi:hypothetical protein
MVVLVHRHSPTTRWPLLVNKKGWDRGLTGFCIQTSLKISLTVREKVGEVSGIYSIVNNQGRYNSV